MDELRALRHQKALELLEEPGMRESFRKDLNLTALKEWEEAGEPFEEDEEILAYLEYKKNEARKNSTDSANSESADGVTRQGSIEIGERSSVNGGKQKIGNKYRIYPTTIRRPRRNTRLLLPKPEDNQLPLHKNDKCSSKKTKSNRISVTVNILNQNTQQPKSS
ncbi:hypothetical protein RhiirA5_384242 [Rhizophagus irregularis]|uniref:Uncharacterized protein n=1 Tax=Rhizophagus irregularis TaxID=588596 RepID=A0A2I1ET57_9GLOM|nr:hypothetical protein RhiirA5_384242 [Rhizophagus irregularis]PKY25308.1 hypothetical protein RhiirB3_388659 [Rhizophagus irregularis]CAB5337091.1 unnamed protein product [Rhizophagus irregularis]